MGGIITHLALALPILFWGTAFPAIRLGLSGYGPLHLALLRIMTGAVLLAIFGYVRGMGLPERRDVPMIFFLGLTGVFLYHIPLNMGERTVSAGAASLLNATAPIFTVLLSRLILGERLSLKGWAGIVLSFGGVALIATGEMGGVSLSMGALWILLAAFSESFYFIFQRGLLKKYGAIRLTIYVICSGAVLMLFCAPGIFNEIRRAPVSATLAAIYMGFFPTAVAYVLWAYDISIFPASRVASLLNISPVIAIAIGWLCLGEVPSTLSMIGGAIAVSGVAVVLRSSYRKDSLD